jgi:beta-N-acetylhexosaminidase
MMKTALPHPFDRRELLRLGAGAAACGALTGFRPLLPSWVSAQADHWVETQMARLSVAEKVGQLICVWPHLVDNTDSLIQSGKVGTVYIDGSVRRKGGAGIGPLEAASLVNHWQRLAKVPLLVTNGYPQLGHVLDGVTQFPSNMAMAATASTELIYQAGHVMALEARALGVHWPGPTSCDVNTNPKNPIINNRSFGDSPGSVAKFAAALVRGMQDHGAIAWAYHFPGHGDTGEDSHLELPTVPHNLTRLENVELVPFRALIQEDVKAICTAHINYPALDPELPATLSRRIVTDLLRNKLGYRGVIGSDALGMKAITLKFGLEEATVMAFRAGIDLLLTWPDAETCFNALLRAVTDSPELRQRLDESTRRILQLKAWAGLSGDVFINTEKVAQAVGTASHRKLALEIARDAVTVIKGGDLIASLSHRSNLLFLITHSTQRRLRTGDWPHLQLGKLVSQLFPQARVIQLDASLSPEKTREILKQAESVDIVIAGGFPELPDYNPAAGLRFSNEVGALLRELIRSRPTVLLCYGPPYAMEGLSQAEALVCCYDDTSPSVEASARICRGESEPAGQLPVKWTSV